MDKKSKYWKICSAIVIILTILVFTPLVSPIGEYKPMLFGIPYTLWMSFLITLSLVIITLIGTKIHPGIDQEENEL